MKILFLSMDSIDNIGSPGIYTDLMRKFWKEGFDVYIVTPRERRTGQHTHLLESDRLHILGVRTLNVQKANVIEKGLGQVLIEFQFKKAIKHYFKKTVFDLILYSTPPITIPRVVEYLKVCNPKAITYLLLKDIFPQNAVDLGMLSTKGLKGFLYRYFRRKERRIYALSDYIGCMSPANVHYVLEHNKEVESQKIEVAPNSYEPIISGEHIEKEGDAIRKKYSLPHDKTIFIYGGNLGKPQGIPFLIECLKAISNRDDCHFVVVGDGTEYSRLDSWYKSFHPGNVSVFRRLPQNDYDQLVQSCDVGLIFLDYRFTIPNYPSRLLSYLMERKPIIVSSDPVCDMGYLAEENGFGFRCFSNSVSEFTECVDRMLKSDIKGMGEAGYNYFLHNYTVDHTYNIIVSHLKFE